MRRPLPSFVHWAPRRTRLDLFISGTAESGVDFVPIDTAIVMEVGQTEQQIVLEVIDDNLPEGAETVTLEYVYVNLCGDTTIASATLIIQDPGPLDGAGAR